jgi:hypothetical protein
MLHPKIHPRPPQATAESGRFAAVNILSYLAFGIALALIDGWIPTMVFPVGQHTIFHTILRLSGRIESQHAQDLRDKPKAERTGLDWKK